MIAITFQSCTLVLIIVAVFLVPIVALSVFTLKYPKGRLAALTFSGFGAAFVTLLYIFGFWEIWVNVRKVNFKPTAVQRTTLGVIFIATVASALFYLKLRSLRSYALLEIAFALSVAAQTVSGLTDEIEPVQAFGILTSSYLLIRGLDNLKKDIDERGGLPSEALFAYVTTIGALVGLGIVIRWAFKFL